MATESPASAAVSESSSPVALVSPGPASRPCLPFPRLLPSLVAAGLLWLCYFPLAWGWLGWLALIPLLCLVRSQGRPRNIYFAAWAGGLAFFWPVLQWMRVADFRMYFTWAMLATYCSLYFPLAIWLIRKLDRKTFLPLMLTVSAVWTGLEFIRSFLLTGFAWYYLGHTQQALLPVIQIADIAGVYGVTFLVAAINAWLFEWLYSRPQCRAFLQLQEPQSPDRKGGGTGKRLPLQGFALFFLIAASLFYGFWRLEQEDFEPGPRLALLQGNLDQRLRNETSRNILVIGRHYQQLLSRAFQQDVRPDLVVWPETSFPMPFPHEYFEISPRFPSEKWPEDWSEAADKSRRFLGDFSKGYPVANLLGLNVNVLDEHGKPHHYNSALLLKAGNEIGDRYDKIHRVPFGEYVPLRDWLPFMNWFAPYKFDYSVQRGEHLTRFKVKDGFREKEHRFGVLICFEDTDPFLARQYGVEDPDGPPADFLINISNDGWFDGTSEHDEHLAISRFRAIECRRALARAVNMGISAVIDSNGRVLEPQATLKSREFQSWEIQGINGKVPELPGSRWGEFKKVAGVLGATVPIDRRFSLYAHLGDWLPGLCWLIILGGLVVPPFAARFGRTRGVTR